MTFIVQTEAPPLREDADGSLRVGTSRVLLDLVIHAFLDGATAESIVQRYDALTLSEVYSVVAYYLRHRSEIDEYLSGREEQATAMAQRAGARNVDLAAVRDRLIARRLTRE